MKNRNRNIPLQFYVTQEEYEEIQRRMKDTKVKNFSIYARKMLLNGMIIVPNWEELKNVHRQISGIGNNINQIARRANETRSIYKDDVEELTHQIGEIRRMLFDLVRLMEKIEDGGK